VSICVTMLNTSLLLMFFVLRLYTFRCTYMGEESFAVHV
jgi:hypothetical protein